MEGKEWILLMDLKGGKITIGELLTNPGTRGVLNKRFPMVFRGKHFPDAAKTVTLEQLVALVGGFLPQKLLSDTLRDLENL